MRTWLAAGCCLLGLVAFPFSARSEPIEVATLDRTEPVDFQKDLLPVFRKKCLACHNATDAESDLVLESTETILKGGFEGPAAVAGNAEESLVFLLAAHRQDPIMPPEDNDAGAANFTPNELALLKLWIDQGAKPSEGSAEENIKWQTIPSQLAPVFAAAQSADGRFVAVGRANRIFVYDLVTATYVDELTDPALQDSPLATQSPVAHLDFVQSLAFSPDRQWIASGGYRTVKLWKRSNSATRREEVDLPNIAARLVHDDHTIYVGTDGQCTIITPDGGQETITLNTDGNGIAAVAVSPSGTHVATIGEQPVIQIWNWADAPIQTLSVDATPQDLAWLSDTELVTSGADTALVVRTFANGQLQGDPRRLEGASQPICVIQPLDNDRFATGGVSGEILIWNRPDGKILHRMDHGGQIFKMSVSSDGKFLVSAAHGQVAKVWKTESGESVRDLNDHPELSWRVTQAQLRKEIAQRHVNNLKSDTDEANKRVTNEEENLKKTQEAQAKAQQELDDSKANNETKQAELRDAQAQAEAARAALKDAESQVESAEGDEAKQAAQKAVESAKQAVEAADNAVKPKTEEANKAAQQVKEKEEALESATRSVETSERALSDAKQRVAELGPRLELAEADLKSANESLQSAETAANESRFAAVNLAFLSGGELAAANEQGTVLIWASAEGPVVAQLETTQRQPVILQDGGEETLRITTRDGQTTEWPIKAHWDLAHVIGAPDASSSLADRVTALTFSPDSRHLAVGGGEPSRSGELKIYSVPDFTLTLDLPDAHSDTIFDVAFSPDGKSIASSGADRFMKTFDLATGQLQRTFEGHTHHVLSVSWRADSRVLATGGADKVVKLWNAEDGSQIRTIQGFGKEVTGVEFAGASDKFYATCGDQNLYRCDMGGERKSIGRSDDFLYVVTADLDGKSVAFAGHDSVVRVVDQEGKALAEIK